MIYIAIVVGCILGALVGMNAPVISYTYSNYLAIAIIAALDSVFGGVTAVLKKNFDLKVFLSGFFGNAILSILLTLLGEKLNVDIYLAAIIVFVGRMFTNLSIIRRYYIELWSEKAQNKKAEKEKNKDKENDKKDNIKDDNKVLKEEKILMKNQKRNQKRRTRKINLKKNKNNKILKIK